MIAPQTNETSESEESGGRIKGVAIAIVTHNNDPQGLGRVKVRFPWHSDPRDSHWARIASPMAGKDRGLVMLPEIDDEVLVAFEQENIRFPYIIGGLWNGQDKPPEKNADGKNNKRLLKSRKKHYLLFDDGPKGSVEIAHEKGRKITLDDNGFVVEDELGNRVKVESASGAMTIEAKGQLKIKAASISIEATGTIEVNSKATMTLRGSLININ